MSQHTDGSDAADDAADAQLRDMAQLAATLLADLGCEGYVVIAIRNTPERGGSSQVLVSNVVNRAELVKTLRWLADDTERQALGAD